MDAVVSAKGAVMERGEGAPLRAAVAAASGSGTSAVAADADAVWSVDEALQRVQWGLFSWRLMFLCGFCYMSDAVEVMLLGFLQVALTAEWGLSPFEASTLTSVVFAGQLLGSALWGPLADRVGRRVGSFSAAVIVAAFGVLSALVPSYGWMLLCRAIVGFGIAGFTVPFDLLAEYMPHHRRGTFLICFQFFWTAGSLLVATLAWACLAALGWRVLTGLSAIPVVLSTMLYAYLPESPSFLLVRGRPADAVAALTAAAAVNGVALPRFTLRAVPEEVASCSRLFMPRLRSTTLLSWTLWFAFGFSYYGIVLLTPELFAEPAATGEAYAIGYANIFAASAAEIVGVVVTLLVIDRWGRKRTQAVMYSFAALFDVLLLLQSSVSRAWLTVLAVCGRIAIMSASSSTWVFTSEVYPTSVRGTGHAASFAVARVAAFLTPYCAQARDVTMVIPVAAYAGINLVAALAAWCYQKETGGTALQNTTVDEAEAEPLGSAGAENARAYRTRRGYAEFVGRQ